MRKLQLIIFMFSFIILITISLININSAGAGTICSSYSNLPWHQLSIGVISCNKKISSCAEDNCQDMLDIFEKCENLSAELTKVDGPSKDTILYLLNSKNIECINIALINILLREIFSKDILDNILELQNVNADIFANNAINQTLNKLDAKHVIEYKDKILRNLKNKSDYDWYILSIMPTLEKIPQDDIFEVYANLLRKNNKAIRLAVYLTIRKYGSEYINKVKEILTKEGDNDALLFLNKPVGLGGSTRE